MISIIDAWDEWTERLDKRSDVSSKPSNAAEVEAPSDGDTRNHVNLVTKGKLVYWGFSYGVCFAFQFMNAPTMRAIQTLLGATFAFLFPDRVGRVVLDGVVDADEYVAPIWVDSLVDTDAIFNSFSKYCHEATSDCALYRTGDDVTDVDNRFQSVMNRIRETPITLINQVTIAPVIIQYSDIKILVFSALYAPQSSLCWLFLSIFYIVATMRPSPYFSLLGTLNHFAGLLCHTGVTLETRRMQLAAVTNDIL